MSVQDRTAFFWTGKVWEACRSDQSFISHQNSILFQRWAVDWDESKGPFSSDCTSSKEATSQKTKSNFPSLLSCVFDPGQIRRKKKKKWRMAGETQRLSEAFFHSWKTAHSSERGFLQSKRLWHYPFPSQLKFIENIQENTARLISSQLACQKQTNTAITRTEKKGTLPQPFEFITGI